jgi:hypothetical protein
MNNDKPTPSRRVRLALLFAVTAFAAGVAAVIIVIHLATQVT